MATVSSGRRCWCGPSAGSVATRWAGIYDVAETNRLAKTLHAWEPEILAFFDTGLTNGPTEGRNLIVKTVKRQGLGYTNPDHNQPGVLRRC